MAGNAIIRDFRLENGTVMPEVTIAYETYGALAPDGRNAVLLTHGYTSPHQMGGAEGSWAGLVGPGKAIDTNRLFVVSSNVLGGCYGSTGPASVNPATGKPYGPEFPDVSLRDMAAAQRAMLDQLGVKHLVAVAGPSYGGYQAFQWGVTYPDFMDGLIVAVSAPKSQGQPGAEKLLARLSTDPNWNEGWYYEKGGAKTVMTDLRVETLKRYGIDAQLAPTVPDAAAREQRIRQIAGEWADKHDPHTMVVLRRAADRYDAEKDFDKLRAKVLYVISRTDKLFPPSIAPDAMAKLKAAGVDATYYEIDSELGHSASGLDAAKWAPTLKAFMDRLTVAA